MTYLNGQVANLFASRGTLQDAYGRALAVESKMMTPENRMRVTQLVADLTSSLQDQTTLENRVRSVIPASWVPQTMGFFPLIVGAGAIAIAGAVYLHIQRVAEHRETLALVEKGVLTPAQAVALQQSGGILGAGGFSGLTGNIGTILALAVGGYALFLFGPMLSQLVRGRK